MSILRSGKKKRLFFEWWFIGMIFFLFYANLQIYFIGTIPAIILFDYFIMERKMMIKNIMIATIIAGSFHFMIISLGEVFGLRIADPFIYAFYHIFISYLIFDKLLKIRQDSIYNLDYEI